MRRAGRTPGRSPVGSSSGHRRPHPDHGRCLGRAGLRCRGTGDRRAPRRTCRTRRRGRRHPMVAVARAVARHAGGRELVRRDSGTRARARSRLPSPRPARTPCSHARRGVRRRASSRVRIRAAVVRRDWNARTQRDAQGSEIGRGPRWPRRVPRPRSALVEGRDSTAPCCAGASSGGCTLGRGGDASVARHATWMTASLCFRARRPRAGPSRGPGRPARRTGPPPTPAAARSARPCGSRRRPDGPHPLPSPEQAADVALGEPVRLRRALARSRPTARRGCPGGASGEDASAGVRRDWRIAGLWTPARRSVRCHGLTATLLTGPVPVSGHTIGAPGGRGRMRPMARDFKTIGVVGLGTMGAGITEVFARHGYSVVGVEVDDDGVDRGRQHIEHSTARAVARGKLTEQDEKELHGRVRFATSLEELEDADLVVEAVVESVDVKKQIFKQLDGIVSEDTILATNTSSLSVTEISSATSQPGRVIGVHFFNPAPVQGFVEIVRTVVTAPEVLEDVSAAGAGARQEPRRVRRQGGLHRQHAAVRLPQPRGVDVRGQLRLPRGHRLGDALRLWLPDGSAGPARPDRAGHGVRDPRHDVPPGPRPPARPGADPQADGHRGPARSQDRQGLLQLRGRRQPGHRRRREVAVGRRQAAAAPRDQPGRRGRHRHDGDRDRRGLRQERVRRHLRRPLPGQGGRRAGHDRALAGQGDPARQARGVRQGARCSAG